MTGPERDLRRYPPPTDVLEREGLRRAHAAVLELLESQEGARSREWQRLTLGELLDHVRGHEAAIEDGTDRDDATGALHAAHLAARALMALACCIELDGGEG